MVSSLETNGYTGTDMHMGSNNKYKHKNKYSYSRIHTIVNMRQANERMGEISATFQILNYI